MLSSIWALILTVQRVLVKYVVDLTVGYQPAPKLIVRAMMPGTAWPVISRVDKL